MFISKTNFVLAEISARLEGAETQRIFSEAFFSQEIYDLQYDLAHVINENMVWKENSSILAEQLKDVAEMSKKHFDIMHERGAKLRESYVENSRLRVEYALINALKPEKLDTAYCVMKTTTTKQIGGFENLVTTVAITSDESLEECSRIMREKIKQCVNGGCTIHTYNIDVF